MIDRDRPRQDGAEPSAERDGGTRVRLAPRLDGDPEHVVVGPPRADGTGTAIDGVDVEVALEAAREGRFRLTLDGARHDLLIFGTERADHAETVPGGTRLEVVVDGWRFEAELEPERRARLRERATRGAGERVAGGPLEVRAIIPGRVVSVEVADGDAVEAGGRLLVVEAMKMQNELRSPRAGAVRRVAVGAGQTVEVGDLLLVVE